jgi:hypothetical protein
MKTLKIFYNVIELGQLVKLNKKKSGHESSLVDSKKIETTMKEKENRNNIKNELIAYKWSSLTKQGALKRIIRMDLEEMNNKENRRYPIEKLLLIVKKNQMIKRHR